MEIPEIKDKELHRIVTTTIVYKLDEDKQLKYLITRRALTKKAMPGMWTVPGGGLTVDDYINTPVTTPGQNQWYGALSKSLVREIKEEVNIEIKNPEFLVDITFIRPDGIPVIIFSYYAKYVSGEILLDEDTIDFKWVNLEEAKKYDLIPGIWDEIKDVEKILSARK